MLGNGQAAPSLKSFADLDSIDDGSITITPGPEQPADRASNWILTILGKGWFRISRLCRPTDGVLTTAGNPAMSRRPDYNGGLGL